MPTVPRESEENGSSVLAVSWVDVFGVDEGLGFVVGAVGESGRDAVRVFDSASFTRLVRVGSPPVMHPTRPRVVCRSREGAVASASDARGWTPVRKTPSNEAREKVRAQGA